MKKCIIAFAAIIVLSTSAYADFDCDTKYYNKIKKVKSFSETEMSKENKDKYLSGLEQAYNLCKEGKKEQAAEILEELKKDIDFDSVFSTHDGN